MSIYTNVTQIRGKAKQKYMKKIKDIRLRVPEEYLEPIKEHAEHAE